MFGQSPRYVLRLYEECDVDAMMGVDALELVYAVFDALRCWPES